MNRQVFKQFLFTIRKILLEAVSSIPEQHVETFSADRLPDLKVISKTGFLEEGYPLVNTYSVRVTGPNKGRYKLAFPMPDPEKLGNYKVYRINFEDFAEYEPVFILTNIKEDKDFIVYGLDGRQEGFYDRSYSGQAPRLADENGELNEKEMTYLALIDLAKKILADRGYADLVIEDQVISPQWLTLNPRDSCYKLLAREKAEGGRQYEIRIMNHMHHSYARYSSDEDGAKYISGWQYALNLANLYQTYSAFILTDLTANTDVLNLRGWKTFDSSPPHFHPR